MYMECAKNGIDEPICREGMETQIWLLDSKTREAYNLRKIPRRVGIMKCLEDRQPRSQLGLAV